MNLTSSIISDLELILKKPLMVFNSEPTIDEFRIYIGGFVHGLALAHNVHLTVNISLWLQKKLNEQTNLVWTIHLLDHYRDRSSEEKKQLLVNTLIDFMKENPDWNTVKQLG